jgi:hypothetical protein
MEVKTKILEHEKTTHIFWNSAGWIAGWLYEGV